MATAGALGAEAAQWSMPWLAIATRCSSAAGDTDAVALAYLALAGPTPRSRLAALMWPDASTPRARANLRQLVHRLQGRADVVTGDPLALRDHVEVVTPGSSSATSGIEEPWVEPIDDLDPDRFGELTSWFRAERERRTTAALLALEQGWRHSTAVGDREAALTHAQCALVVDPHAEQGRRRLMRAQLELGRVRDALTTYQRCRRWLRNDLDQEPDAATATPPEQPRHASCSARSPGAEGTPRPRGRGGRRRCGRPLHRRTARPGWRCT